MSLYPVKVQLYEDPIGGSEKCHCKRGASYCVTVSGEPCIYKKFTKALNGLCKADFITWENFD